MPNILTHTKNTPPKPVVLTLCFQEETWNESGGHTSKLLEIPFVLPLAAFTTSNMHMGRENCHACL